MYSRFIGLNSSVMDMGSSSQRDEQEIRKVSEDANRAYDALQKEEEREHRLRFELETLLNMEANMLKKHHSVTKETDLMDREIELLDHENAVWEARTAFSSEKLSNTKRLYEEKELKVKEMNRKFEERQRKLQKHRQQMNERSAQIKATVQQKLADYRSMPLCNEFYELQNKLILLSEKREATQKKLEELEAKLVCVRESNKEEWQKFVGNCIVVAKNYMKCKEEALKKKQSTSRRAQDILDRHYKKRDQGFAAPSASKYMTGRTPFLSAWSRRQSAGALHSTKDTTFSGPNSQRSSYFNPKMYSPYGNTRELMEKLKAIKLRPPPPPPSFFSSRKRISADVEDSPATKKPADADSILKNYSYQVPTSRQDTQNSSATKNDVVCITNPNDRLEQKASQSGSGTSVSMEQPTYLTTSRVSANESRSLSAEMKRSIINTSVHNLRASQSHDGTTAPGTPMTASIPEQAEFLSQSGSKLVSLNNMNVSINVNVSQNNSVSATQQLLGDGNGTGFFVSPPPVFNTSRAPTPSLSPQDFTAMVNLASFVPSVGSSPNNQHQQQGITGATSTPSFLPLQTAKQAGTSAASDFFMGIGGMDSTNDRSYPSGASAFSTDFFGMKTNPSSVANDVGSFSFDTNFGKNDGMGFPAFALNSDSVNNEEFNSRPFF